MKKTLLLFLLIIIRTSSVFSIDKPVRDNKLEKDTIRTLNLDEFVITSSAKETNILKRMPTTISIVSPKMLQDRQIESLTSLSGLVPNFFIPDYGSKVSTPIYIRGVGARSGSQTVSLYVDNIPYFNPSAFDFEFQDIQRIEVLRGAQGTLYGRNAIGGIVNISTLSPLTYQGSSVTIGGGNYGHREARISNYYKIKTNFGSSLVAYYKENDGFFLNKYSNKKIDESKTAGGRVKFEWKPTRNFTASLTNSFDYISQGAFPYMHIDSLEVNFNDPSSYRRKLFSQGLSLNFKKDNYTISSTTSYQYLNDDMQMDQDYSPLSIFSIQQFQNQQSISQEITFKSNRNKRYKWVIGAFGFYDYKKTTTPVAIKEDGIGMLQNKLDEILSNVPIPPNMSIPNIEYANRRIDLPGIYRKPSKGIAFFEQSSLNDLFGLEELALTFGIRADFEHTAIDYFTETHGVDVKITPPNAHPSMPPIEIKSDTLLEGRFSKGFWQVLPKFALQYDISTDGFVYLSASKGYKAGGYNEQSFSEILQENMQKALMQKVISGAPGIGEIDTPPSNRELSLEERLSFDPETSWNYELGGRFSFLNNRLNTTFTLFSIAVNNIQIIHLLSQATGGRTITNAGKSSSKGFELSLAYSPTKSFSTFLEYGYVNASFKNYYLNETNYSGNYIPFAPQNTLTLGANYTHIFHNNIFLDRLTTSVHYNSAGKIYWNNSNDAYQSYYGLINASINLEKKNVSFRIWSKNILNKKYNAFYFEAADLAGNINPLVQKGYPARFGASLKYTIDY